MTPLLKVENLIVKFDGLTAVDNVSLTIGPSEIRGLIGPNGAGKTTLFNTISGLAPASAGRIILDGEDVTLKAAPLRALKGVRRTFQTVQLIQSFTVYENLLLGLDGNTAGLPTLVPAWPSHGNKPVGVPGENIQEVLAYLRIGDFRDRVVGSLTIAQQRYVEIGRALVSRPKLLMLDEPTAGLSPAQIELLDGVIQKLPGDWNVAVLLVEHVIPLVIKLCNQITVLDRGKIIAEGSGSEIQSNAAVQEAYLGDRLDA